MAQFSVTLVLSLVVALAWRAYGQDDFSLEDAFDDIPTQKPAKPGPKPPKGPTHIQDDFDLSDLFETTKSPKVIPKRPTKRPDVFIPTKKPRASTPKPPKKTGPDYFNLEDILSNRNDTSRGGFDEFDLSNGVLNDRNDTISNGVVNDRNDTISGVIKQEVDPSQEVKSPDSSSDDEIRMILQTFSHEIKSMQRKIKNLQTLLGQVTQFVETSIQSKKAA